MRISDWSSDVCSSDLGWEGDRIDVTGGSEVDAAAIFLPVAITCRLRAIAATDFRRPWLATRRRRFGKGRLRRAEEHPPELQSLMPISYAVFCLKKKNKNSIRPIITITTQIRPR